MTEIGSAGSKSNKITVSLSEDCKRIWLFDEDGELVSILHRQEAFDLMDVLQEACKKVKDI